MTKEQFLPGFMLLIAQPWGRRYELHTQEGQLQSEFYYSQVQRWDAETWTELCRIMATGKAWPSIAELRESYRPPRRPALPRADRPVPMPDEVRDKLRSLGCLSAIEEAAADGQQPGVQTSALLYLIVYGSFLASGICG